MPDLEEITRSNPKKRTELAAFHWFAKAASIEYESFEIGERPDFVMMIDGFKIGIEITEAHRPINDGAHPHQAIESRQEVFADALVEAVGRDLPLEIHLAFEDGIRTEKDMLDRISPIADKIKTVFKSMPSNSAMLTASAEKDMDHNYAQSHICPEIPMFLQNIQLIKSDLEGTRVTASRGSNLHPLSADHLDEILAAKHKSLKNYRKCDEHWLVIVARHIPEIFLPHEMPRITIPGTAKEIKGIGFDIPIRSDFDRVYFFECPVHVELLTG